MSDSDLGTILREDEQVLSRIREFIRTRFGASGRDFELVGRERELFESLVDEVERVRFSFADAEKRQLLLEAELAGVKAGCLELEKQIQLVKQVCRFDIFKLALVSLLNRLSLGCLWH